MSIKSNAGASSSHRSGVGNAGRTGARFGVAAFMISVAPSALAQTAAVTAIPDMTQPFSISRDGNVVVGYRGDPATEPGANDRAIRWTAIEGAQDLGVIGGSPGVAQARSTNQDGSVVIGFSSVGSLTTGQNASESSQCIGYQCHAFRWTAAGGMQDLGTIGNYAGTATVPANSIANGVSADGLVVVGTSDYAATAGENENYHAFRWTAAGGMQDLGGLQPGFYSSGIGTNADGSVVVGSAEAQISPSETGDHAFRWTAAGGMQDLGTLGGDISLANRVSLDGEVVVGFSHTASGDGHAFRWQGGGMVDLGTIDNFAGDSEAVGVSGDGSVIVGLSETASGDHAFRWTAATGLADLNTLMSDAGVSMTGIIMTNAADVSANGEFIVGSAEINGSTQGYIARYTTAVSLPVSPPTSPPVSPPVSPPTSPPVSPPVSPPTSPPVSPPVSPPTSPPVSPPVSPPTSPPVSPPVSPPSSPPVGPPVSPPVPPIAGVTTVASVRNSVEQLGAGRTRMMIQHHGLAAQALGADDPETTRNHIAVFGSVGSQSIGLTGRAGLGGGVSLSAAIFDTSAHYDSSRYGQAELKNSITYGAALRYIDPGDAAIKPYAEIGGWIAPDAKLNLGRTYSNGSGMAFGSARTKGSLSYFYARGGIALAAGAADHVTLSAEIGRERLHSRTYSEALSSLNPFEAHVSAATDRSTIGKLAIRWQRDLVKRVDFALRAGLSHSFSYRSNLLVAVPGVGILAPENGKNPTWAEYGAQIGYHVSPSVSLRLFAEGVAGGDRFVGSETHFGAALKVEF